MWLFFSICLFLSWFCKVTTNYNNKVTKLNYESVRKGFESNFSRENMNICKCWKLVVYSVQSGSNLNYGMLM